MALMNSPRCSLPDQEEPSKSVANPEGRNMRRGRRAISMWTCRNINWRLHSYTSSSHLSRGTVRSLVLYALRVWAEPTPLEFHEVSSPEAADLQLDFLHGYHGDSYPFDGACGAVGHAFFPSGRKIINSPSDIITTSHISSLLFAEVFASSSTDLQLSLGWLAAECEVAGMKISTSKSEAMVLSRKWVDCLLQVGGRPCLRWRSLSISGFCSQVRVGRSGRSTGGFGRCQQ
uniref:Peptidase metallopeptidase domain-containing protein n=1 Tax=Seriola lalandi dorsalis TaxID=1841481 RepID=A0A3B4X4M0_SERLL